MPRNDREVFEHLISDNETPPQIDFLTYAVFAYEKREWIKLYESQNGGQAPQQADIDTWIFNLTDSQFLSMRSGAEAFFIEAANAYFEERIEQEKREILRSVIVAEIKSAGAFWKQIAIALLTTILAPVMIGLVITALYFFDNNMPSSESIAKHFHSMPKHDAPGAASPATPLPVPQ